MPLELEELTAPQIEVPVAEDVTLRVTDISVNAAAKIMACLQEHGGQIVYWDLAKIILDNCQWQVTGPITKDGAEVENIERRREITRRAMLVKKATARQALVDQVMVYIEAVPGNLPSPVGGATSGGDGTG